METIYLTLHCHRQNDPRTQMGYDESRFNASLAVRDKVTKDGVHTPHKLKPVLNWAKCLFAEHTSESSTN